MTNMKHRGTAAASMQRTDTCPLQHRTVYESRVSAQTGTLDAAPLWRLQPYSTFVWNLDFYPYPMLQKVHLRGDLKIGPGIGHVGKQQQCSWEQSQWDVGMGARWWWVEKWMGGDEVEAERVQTNFSRVFFFLFFFHKREWRESRLNPPSSPCSSLMLLPTHPLWLNKEGKRHEVKQDLCLKFDTSEKYQFRTRSGN